MTERPRRPHLDLGRLETGDGDLLAIERHHDRLHFADLDLSGDRLHDRTLTECLMERVGLNDTVLTGVHLREVRVDACTASSLPLSSSRLREVEIVGGRYGALEIYDASLAVVEFRGVRVDYLNLRGSKLADVGFVDCHIGELDLGDATATRVTFDQTTLTDLALSGAQLADVDLRGAALTGITGLEHLRGATVSGEQLGLLAPLLADAWGIRVG